jgi:hypothetical protein
MTALAAKEGDTFAGREEDISGWISSRHLWLEQWETHLAKVPRVAGYR